MPSGPKKRLRAKRNKQGSPATDANSDRETEGLSVTGSADVDDVDSGLDTPLKGSSRPAFLDKEAVSSQTDEWVRVSDFDVGTPTSQTEENDPSAEDGDVGSSRRSLDKLAEWETVSGEHIPGRQEGSTNSLEEEPSECEEASAHSSESYTNLPSFDVVETEKDGDSSDNDRKNLLPNRSTETFDLPASIDVRDHVFLESDEPPLRSAGEGEIEHIDKLNEYFVREESAHGFVPVTPSDSDEAEGIADDTTISEETTAPASNSEDSSAIANPGNQVGEAQKQGKDEDPTASTESRLVAAKPDSQQVILVNEKDVTLNEEEALPTAEDSVTQGSISEDGKFSTPSLNEQGKPEDAVASSLLDGDREVVCKGDKFAIQVGDDSTVAVDKEVASTSAKAEDKKSTINVTNSELATSLETKLPNPQELAGDSLSVKAVPLSGTSEPVVLAEEDHLSISTPVEKNAAEKHQTESKSLTGCCDVLYWLLGWDH